MEPILGSPEGWTRAPAACDIQVKLTFVHVAGQPQHLDKRAHSAPPRTGFFEDTTSTEVTPTDCADDAASTLPDTNSCGRAPSEQSALSGADRLRDLNIESTTILIGSSVEVGSPEVSSGSQPHTSETATEAPPRSEAPFHVPATETVALQARPKRRRGGGGAGGATPTQNEKQHGRSDGVHYGKPHVCYPDSLDNGGFQQAKWSPAVVSADQQPHTKLDRENSWSAAPTSSSDTSVAKPLKIIHNVEEVFQLYRRSSATCGAHDLIEFLRALARWCESSEDAHPCGASREAQQIIAQLRKVCGNIRQPRAVADMLWSLGKIGARSNDVARIVMEMESLERTSRLLLADFTPQDLSKSIHALAKLCSVNGCRPWAERLAVRILQVCKHHLRALTSQCISNSLWGVAKLDLRGARGDDAVQFANACVVEALLPDRLSGFCPQGFANSVWAIGKLELRSWAAEEFCRAWCKTVTRTALQDYKGMELSMAVWGCGQISTTKSASKASSRSHRGKPTAGPEMRQAVLLVVEDACKRVNELSPQALSNIAQAIVKMGLTHQEPTRRFLMVAAQRFCDDDRVEIHYPAQAVANLCWAISRIGDMADDEVVFYEFMPVVATQAKNRMHLFEVRDLSGILSAMSFAHMNGEPAVLDFARALVWHVTERICSREVNVEFRTLLNIALSAMRLGVYREDLEVLVTSIKQLSFERHEQGDLNSIDRRQLHEVLKMYSSASAAVSFGEVQHDSMCQGPFYFPCFSVSDVGSEDYAQQPGWWSGTATVAEWREN